MKKTFPIVFTLLALSALTTACGGKKQSSDIIAPRVVKSAPKGPITMQGYTDERDVPWLGKNYRVVIVRAACDTLPLVKSEDGQKYVDNMFSLRVIRPDGSVAISHTLTKGQLSDYLDDDFRRTGVFEGLVFDRVEGDELVFAASVGHPQTDEYIPLVLNLTRMGILSIKRDTQLDTTPEDAAPQGDDLSDDGI